MLEREAYFLSPPKKSRLKMVDMLCFYSTEPKMLAKSLSTSDYSAFWLINFINGINLLALMAKVGPRIAYNSKSLNNNKIWMLLIESLFPKTWKLTSVLSRPIVKFRKYNHLFAAGHHQVHLLSGNKTIHKK